MNFPLKATFRLLIIAFCVIASTHNAVAQERMTRDEYIARWRHLAIDNMEVYGIPASITMAQALLESAAGNSELSKRSNNHFGIKCKSTWTGNRVYHDDDEKGECFRAYPTVDESYADHAEFLNVNKRYDALFALDADDYKGWAHGLKAAGYATAPDYAERLIKIIEEEHLYLLDQKDGLALYDQYRAEKVGITAPAATPPADETPANSATVGVATSTEAGFDPDNFRVTINSYHGYNVYLTNGAHHIVAKEGDTYESIGRLFDISSSTLRRFNDVGGTAQPMAGDIVYIERKAARWKGDAVHHTAHRNETLYQLAQHYGIRLDQLSKLNRMRASDPLNDGQMIRLR